MTVGKFGVWTREWGERRALVDLLSLLRFIILIIGGRCERTFGGCVIARIMDNLRVDRFGAHFERVVCEGEIILPWEV